MKQRFKNRGYSEPVLNRAINIANDTTRDVLLGDNKSKNKNNYKRKSVPVFSTPFSAEFSKDEFTIRKYLPILFNGPVYAQILSRGNKTVSRRAPTLGSSVPKFI